MADEVDTDDLRKLANACRHENDGDDYLLRDVADALENAADRLEYVEDRLSCTVDIAAIAEEVLVGSRKEDESTPDSECCGADLGATDDVLLCAECGGHCGYSGYRWRPDCRGVVVEVVDDTAEDDKRATVRVERDEGEPVEAETGELHLITHTAGLTAEPLVGKPVGLEPRSGDGADWRACFLDGIDYEEAS